MNIKLPFFLLVAFAFLAAAPEFSEAQLFRRNGGVFKNRNYGQAYRPNSNSARNNYSNYGRSNPTSSASIDKMLDASFINDISRQIVQSPEFQRLQRQRQMEQYRQEQAARQAQATRAAQAQTSTANYQGMFVLREKLRKVEPVHRSNNNWRPPTYSNFNPHDHGFPNSGNRSTRRSGPSRVVSW